MATLTYSLVITADRHLRVMVGRQREYLSLENKTRKQLFEAVKYALISKNVPVNAEVLNMELDAMIWQHVPKWKWYDEDD